MNKEGQAPVSLRKVPGTVYGYGKPGEEYIPGVVFITTYPPRECGIATYSQDLETALRSKFGASFTISICPLLSDTDTTVYQDDFRYRMNTDRPGTFDQLAEQLNKDESVSLLLIQHEFGLFRNSGPAFVLFLRALKKPVILVFHTVLSGPDASLLDQVQEMAAACDDIIVMTHTSERILVNEYGVEENKITVIPHGTHLVPHTGKEELKKRYNLSGRKVLTTFGLLSSGKGIETTLAALPAVISKYPEVLFLIIGKTHPSVVKAEGELYREKLQAMIRELHLESHVRFINYFVQLRELLDYLQLTDIYLFTSRDPAQAVSGTFAYAISCGCPVISTPIPHAREVLQKNSGIIIGFNDVVQMADSVLKLLQDDELRETISSNGLHRMASTAWENSAIAHALLFKKMTKGRIRLKYTMPPISLDHLKKMTTDFGMIQFSRLNKPDIETGFTLDDNARALIAWCQHFELTGDKQDLRYIRICLDFILYCQQPDGRFLNYTGPDGKFTPQNEETNLEDSNGRAIWALGYLVSKCELLPGKFSAAAFISLQKASLYFTGIHSTRAMAFIVKGLFYKNSVYQDPADLSFIKLFADRLVQMYRHESDDEWRWYEGYLTYANSLLPEALLCAWQATGNLVYRGIAKRSFDFLLAKTFRHNRIAVIPNKIWLHDRSRTAPETIGGEQPIDVAYTILALKRFYDVFEEDGYRDKLQAAFNWFLGDNHLSQIIYNPCTGGCYDGLEETCVNLNQGAESTVSYIMARLTIGMHLEQMEKREREREQMLQNALYDLESV